MTKVPVVVEPVNLIFKLRQQKQQQQQQQQQQPQPKTVRSGVVASIRRPHHDPKAEWTLPIMAKPDLMDDRPHDEVVVVEEERRGVMDNTDASLFTLPEVLPDGSEKLHSVLCLPTVLPPSETESRASSSTFNILMADVSVSMSRYWKAVVEHWNRSVSPALKGRTSLYVFSNQVFFMRSATYLEQGDFYSGATDLVGALETIVTEVYRCRERYVKVFLITDGDHSLSQLKPEDVIGKMEFPVGKVCDVYVLGVGDEFPVRHSLGLRSRLHNGRSNIPYLYTAKSVDEVREQMVAIGRSLTIHGQAITLSVEGTSLPGTTKTFSFQPGEWVYFPHDPSHLQQLTITFDKRKGQLNLQPIPIDLVHLNDVFRQWNSRIIQLFSNGGREQGVISDVIAFKERLFNTQVQKLRKGTSYTVSERLARKHLAHYESNFKASANKLDSILNKTFRNEQELAENVLCTTTEGTKYETRVFKLKGHTDQDFQSDQEEFMRVYASNKRTSST
ncbi:uncharacterized protein [Panulirus ornatus]|uniref:uncharacterized protein n=1 Tax=Panulirus ornatus TaxID=150431 RepID=UPI003A86B6B5